MLEGGGVWLVFGYQVFGKVHRRRDEITTSVYGIYKAYGGRSELGNK